MSVLKVIELMARSEKGWEDATRIALEEASKSVKNIHSMYVKEFKVDVSDNKVTHFVVNVKVSFEVQK